jgi:methylmalonyl-CoA/ethylmalonyl-CoA epimerase
MKIDHTGIAVRRIDEAIEFYTVMLGGKLLHRYTSEKPGVETHIAVIEMENQIIELLEPTSKTSPIERSSGKKEKVSTILPIKWTTLKKRSKITRVRESPF